ncbi:hypothetical protein ACIHQR_36725 [Corallococcus coralloides]|uniref:hypothetical protein n=1 Tax=Corallococcus coralloides TaxID=184914 RepID=UPI00384E7057
MASKSKQAFMLPDEFLDLLVELRTSMKLIVVLQRAGNLRETWDGNRGTFNDTPRVFLADAENFDADSLTSESAPVRLGWVVVDVPGVEDDRLFVVQIGARSDWFDKTAGMVRENKHALKWFDRVWRRFAQRLRFPTLVRNIVTGVEASYSSVGYSAGAVDWFRSARRLRQRGVENIEFLIPDTTNA